MNIDLDNFEEQADRFIQHLPKASFISFDLEMSGIKTDDYRSSYDLPYDYYHKCSVAPRKYGVIQIGFTLFEETSEEIIARPYNFITFPRPYTGKFVRDISIDPDCVNFHIGVGTDFQRWLTKGVGYFDTYNLSKLEKAFFNSPQPRKNSKPNNKMEKEEDINKFNKFTESYLEFVESQEKEFEVSESNSFMRFHFYQHINETTPNFSYETISEDKSNKTIKVTRLSKEEREEFDEMTKMAKEDEFNKIIGFTRVWNAIKEAGKPLIGHNCFMDLIFTFEHFEKKLPKKFSDFKVEIHNHFPTLYDTKVIAGDEAIDNKDISTGLNLESLYKALREKSSLKLRIPTEEGFIDFNQDIETFHDAGYDAFVTGAAFAFIRDLYGSEVLERNTNLVRLFTNKLFISDFSDPEKDKIICSSGMLAVLNKKLSGDKQKMFEMLGRLNKINSTYPDIKFILVHSHLSSKDGLYYHIVVTFPESLIVEKFNIKESILGTLKQVAWDKGTEVVGVEKYYETMNEMHHNTMKND